MAGAEEDRPEDQPAEERDVGCAPEEALDLALGKAALARTLERAIARLRRRVEAVGRDLAKMDDAERWVARAAWLVPLASRAPRGATELAGSDWSSGEEERIVVPLDPSKSAREQVDAIFQEARRLRRGRPTAEKRRDEAARSIDALCTLLEKVLVAASLQEIEPLAAEAERIAPREVPRAADAGRLGRAFSRAPYRSFKSDSGLSILVGRGASQNDELTLHVARPHHVWLHAKGTTGAHVVAVVDKGRALTPEELLDATHLAAHFSSSRGEAVVDVSWTERRYVRKPRKSPPGAVLVDREHVLVLRVEPARLVRLLASEVEERPPPAPSRNEASNVRANLHTDSGRKRVE